MVYRGLLFKHADREKLLMFEKIIYLPNFY